MTDVFIGIGTNIGGRYGNIAKAIELISKIAIIDRISSIYETEPEGYKDQPYFLNSVIKIKTNLEPEALLACLQNIEKEMGRKPSFKDAPRVIDLDILIYGDVVLNKPDLQIPHPRLHERSFVLVPLVEIAPELEHPILHNNIIQLIQNLDSPGQVEKRCFQYRDFDRRKDVSDIC